MSSEQIYWISYEQKWATCTRCSKEDQVHKLCYVEKVKELDETCCPDCLRELRIQVRGTPNLIKWTPLHAWNKI